MFYNVKNNRLFQIIFPLLFLVYFDHYMILKNAAHTADISLKGIFIHVLTYFMLLILFGYTAVVNCQNKKGIIYGILGWIETVVLWLVPLTFMWHNELFIRIKEYLVDYLHIYGSIVLLYSIQLLYFYHLYRRK